MAVRDKAYMKSRFVKGAKPVQADYVDLIDSYQDAGSSDAFTAIGQALVNSSTQASARSAIGIDFVTTAQAVAGALATGGMNPVLVKNQILSSFGSTDSIQAATVSGVSIKNSSGTTLLNVGGSSLVSVTGASLNTARGSDIASASTTSIGTATGNFVHITGTTTINSFGSAASGAIRVLRFASALTLTHNATSLILPGGANITTATNDVAIFINDNGASNWRCVSYERASGSSSGALTLIKTTTVSSPVSSVDFVNGVGGVVLNSTYKNYIVTISGLIPSTDSTQLWMRTSTNAGVSYDNGASNYYGRRTNNLMSGGYSADQSSALTEIPLTQTGVVKTAGRLDGFVSFSEPNSSLHFLIEGNIRMNQEPAGTSSIQYISTHARNALADVDAIRFLMSTGNIELGTFSLYGIAS